MKKGILKPLWEEYIMRHQDNPVKLSVTERSELEEHGAEVKGSQAQGE